MEKCDFCTTSITFLGFIVGQEQLSPAAAKVNGVADWLALFLQTGPMVHGVWKYISIIRDYSKVFLPSPS